MRKLGARAFRLLGGFFFLSLQSSACATTNSGFRVEVPDTARATAAIFGRVRVTENGKPITEYCYFELNGAGEHKATVILDESGWVFARVSPGMTYLTGINCPQFGPARLFVTHEIKFEASGGRDLAYFGDVHVDMHPANLWADMARAGVGGLVVIGLAAGHWRDGKPPVARVEEHFGEAVGLYRSSYPELMRDLTPFIAMRGSALRTTQPEVGIVRSESRIDGATLRWLGLPAQHPTMVTLRVERDVEKVELINCRELRILIDGQAPRSYHLSHPPPQRVGSRVRETVQADIEYAALQAIEVAAHAEFEACTFHGLLTQEVVASLHKFEQKFDAQLSATAAGRSQMKKVSATAGP